MINLRSLLTRWSLTAWILSLGFLFIGSSFPQAVTPVPLTFQVSENIHNGIMAGRIQQDIPGSLEFPSSPGLKRLQEIILTERAVAVSA